jgi:lipid II:glycine glycyltransferase (peptidoglycan interpeptide bridge formation enzyme)
MRHILEDKTFLKNITVADLSVCETADSFLQSTMWGRFKARFGWEARAFVVEWADGGDRPLLTLSRRIAPGVTMTYIPWGPEFPEIPPPLPLLYPNAMLEIARALRPRLPHVAFIRFDPPEESTRTGERVDEQMRNGVGQVQATATIKSEGPPPWFTEATDPTPLSFPAPFKRAAADIQPPDTVLVDLTPSPEDILAAMKPKWRYNIGLAAKRAVTVTQSDVNKIDIFYRLLTETAERDGIAIHSIEYYRALFEECRNDETSATPARLHLYIAEHEGDVLAAIVTLFRGKQATYLYGASANVKRNLMAPYALQWKAMQDAREYGCAVYDLFGIPPNEDPDHPMVGLYRFKTGFGGRIIHRPGSWDYPCKPALYALFSGAERLRKKMRDRRKKPIPRTGTN